MQAPDERGNSLRCDFLMNSILLRESALIVVDVQQGFTTLCPRELPVPGGLEIVPAVNRLLALDWARIDATTDWHPPDHRSFLGQGDNLYPPHCMQNTAGADFVPGLDTHRFQTIWRKGFQRNFEAYAVTAQHPGIVELYRDAKLTTVVVCGIATNICCYFTARDFRGAGFRVVMIEDASAGIDVPAAGLFQVKAKEDGVALGIEYALSRQLSFS
jgi:nicotinamidase/pyrazinamidase